MSFAFLMHGAAVAQPAYDAAAELIPGNLDAAAVQLDALYEQAVKSDNDALETKVLYLKALLNYYKGNYYIAADYYERVLTHEDYLNQNLLAKEGILNNLGICYEYIEDLDRAFRAYSASLDIAMERGDSSGIVMSWINLGLLATNQDNLDLGEQYLRRAEAYCRGKPDERYNLALVHNNLTHLLEKQKGKRTEMLDYLGRAGAVFQEVGDTLNWVMVLANQVYAYSVDKDDLAKAKDQRQLLQQIATQTTLPAALTAFIARVEGDYWIAQGKYTKALEVLASARDSYRQQLNIQELRRTYRRMQYALAAQGDFKAYARLDEEAYRELASAAQARSKARYEELSILYDVKHKEAAISALDNQVKILDRSLTKAIRTTQIQGFLLVFLLLLLLTIGLLIGFTRQYRSLQGLQSLLFKRSRELDALKEAGVQPRGEATLVDSGGELAPTPDDEDQQVRDLFLAIDAQMKQEKWYLDPAFGLKELSKRINTNVTYASKAINTHSGGNFSQYLNTFRVQAAKVAMEQAVAHQAPLTITELAIMNGFSNYNTFHRVFRAETGLTPSQYLKLLAQKSS